MEGFICYKFDVSDATYTWKNFEEEFAGQQANISEIASKLTKIMRIVVGKGFGVVKLIEDEQLKIDYKPEDALIRMMKQVRCHTMIGTRLIKVSAYDAYLEYKSKFNIDCIKFCTINTNYVSIYHGLYYKTDAFVNEELISKFLKHIHDVICNNNETLYNFVLDWISYILKKPYNKTKSVLCLIGEQGTGKNILTKVICELLHGYSVVANKIDQILGKNNQIIENKRIVIGDEVSQFNKGKIELWNSFKHDVTEFEGMFEDKFIPQHPGENVANYILVSNNDICVPIEDSDRRYLVLKVSSVHKQDKPYFDDLCADIWTKNEETGKLEPIVEFFDSLTTYFYTRVISKNTNLERAPDTEDKSRIRNEFKTGVEQFIEDNYDKLTSDEGFLKSEAQQEFTHYLKNGETAFTFSRKLNKYCMKNKYDENGKLISRNLDVVTSSWGVPVRVYKLTDEARIKFAPPEQDIIEQSNEEGSAEEETSKE